MSRQSQYYKDYHFEYGEIYLEHLWIIVLTKLLKCSEYVKTISLQSWVFYSQFLLKMHYASLIAFFVMSSTKKMTLPDIYPFEKLFVAVLCYCSIDLKTFRFFNLTWKFSACNSSQNCPLK